jgi:biopolymer transport protein ExbB/TolQ/biopolymer transport protein ExbD
MPGVCPNSWQTYGCEWTIGYLWRWANLLERLDLIVLAVMLAHVVVVVARVSYRYRLARHAAIDTASEAFQGARRKLAAELSIEVGSLKSIAFTAPYLGLAGTCVGILSIFRAYVGSRYGALVMVVSGIDAAFISSAAGLLVAVPAVVSYNYLRTRIDSLESEMYSKARRSRHFQVAQKLPLTPRFSKLPFAVIAVPALAISVAAFVTFSSFATPKGLPVRLVKTGALEAEHFTVKPIVIEITRTGGNGLAVYVNSKKAPFDELERRLQSELKARPLACIKAENGVSWGDVISVIDVVEGLHADVVLLTITPTINIARKSIR